MLKKIQDINGLVKEVLKETKIAYGVDLEKLSLSIRNYVLSAENQICKDVEDIQDWEGFHTDDIIVGIAQKRLLELKEKAESIKPKTFANSVTVDFDELRATGKKQHLLRGSNLEYFILLCRIKHWKNFLIENSIMTINDIRNLIRKGDLDKAIDALFMLADKLRDQDLSDNVTLQSSRYHKNEKDNNNGVVGSDFYARTRAQVTSALQSYLNEISDVNVTIDMPMPVDSPAPVPVPVPEKGITSTTGTGNGGGTGTGDGRTTILILASNPSGTGILQVEVEHSRISNKIQESDHADAFRIKSKKAVTLSEFQEYLYDERPTIVHFSGHGEKSNPEVQDVIRRGLNLSGDTGQQAPQDDTGIILYDESKRNPLFVNTAVVKRIFKTMVERQGIPIKAVLFNSCYSEAQAEALAQIVPYVIGTSWSVRDDAAIAFATGFYSGIARGEDIRSACDFGINQALAYGEPEERFVLYENGTKVVW